jgi:hypothetical protein
MNVGIIKSNFNANPDTCGYGSNGLRKCRDLKGTRESTSRMMCNAEQGQVGWDRCQKKGFLRENQKPRH